MNRLEEIRQGLAARVDTIVGVKVYDHVPDSITTLSAVVVPGDPYLEYHGSLGPGGLVVVNLEVLLLAQKAVAKVAQQKLDALLFTGGDDQRSVVDAIDNDRTLGLGSGVAAQVGTARGWGITTVNEIGHWSVRLGVTVRTYRQ